jgi:hypothetical protein
MAFARFATDDGVDAFGGVGVGWSLKIPVISVQDRDILHDAILTKNRLNYQTSQKPADVIGGLPDPDSFRSGTLNRIDSLARASQMLLLLERLILAQAGRPGIVSRKRPRSPFDPRPSGLGYYGNTWEGL